jgi:CelD/BcsL family acetyltransferase involved in cellulose biosynthesis
VIDIDPATDDRWRLLVETRRSDVFHSPAWIAVLRDTYGFDLRGRVLSEGGRVVAGLAYALIDDVFGRRRVSLPFSDFCDPLVDHQAHWDALTDDLLDERVPFSFKPLFDDVAHRDPRLAERGRVKWHRADVVRDVDAMWNDLHASARRAVRKAEKAGITVRAAQDLGDMRKFFELHLRTRKQKYSLLAQPWPFFEAIWMAFMEQDQGHLLVAEVDGRPIAGVVYLRWKDTFYYKFNASEAGALDLRPNDLIMWHGLSLAHRAGASWVDFGVSDLDQEGLIRYKQKYATEEGEVLVLKRMDSDPPQAAARSVLGEVTDLLTDPSVPDAITEKAGDSLYRFFT